MRNQRNGARTNGSTTKQCTSAARTLALDWSGCINRRGYCISHVPPSRRQVANQGVYQVTEKHVPTGLWSQNRPEWQLSDIACMSQSLYSVSIYDTLGPDTAVYIINHAELTTVVASLAVRILSPCSDGTRLIRVIAHPHIAVDKGPMPQLQNRHLHGPSGGRGRGSRRQQEGNP